MDCCATEMAKTETDSVFIDVTHLPQSLTTTRFPHIYRFCLAHGLDITRSPVPVAPAAHYMMGGVKVNTWGATSIAGLFATGEVARTGVHGANRLASNSMLEVLVFSKRIIQKTAGSSGFESPVASEHYEKGRRLDRYIAKGSTSPPGLSEVQTLLWDKVGIIRGGNTLREAAKDLAAWQAKLTQPTDRASYELGNILLTGQLMTEAALIREESRGAHFRADFPRRSAKWEREVIFTSN